MRAPGGSLLATSTVCPKCGFANQAGYQFCSNCGNPLGAAPAPAAAAPYGVPPPTAAPAYGAPPYAAPPGYPAPYGYGPSPWEYERTKQIDRTKTGILLLLVGSLLSWVPIANIIGYLLLFIGAILVILGRRVFGNVHARNVIVSLVLVILGFAAEFIAGLGFAASIAPALIGGTVTQEAVQNAFNILLIGGLAGAVILGIAEVLFIYALQNPTGKVLLWSAVAASIILQIVSILVVSSALVAQLPAIFSGGTPDVNAILALQGEASQLAYLSVIPAALFAAADYLAWSRINRGEVPAQPQAPGMPAAPPMPPR